MLYLKFFLPFNICIYTLSPVVLLLLHPISLSVLCFILVCLNILFHFSFDFIFDPELFKNVLYSIINIIKIGVFYI